MISRPRAMLIAWALLLATALFALPRLHGTRRAAAPADAIGPDEPAIRGERLAREAFPSLYASSDVALVFARRPALTDADLAAIRAATTALRAAAGGTDHVPWSVRSAETDPLLAGRLLARDAAGRATCALVVVSYDAEYDSDESIDVADRVESIARAAAAAPSDGLAIELTGAGAMGRDESRAEEVAHRRITVASVLAVLAVLLAVYRAPLAASVPLLCVAASAVVSTKVLELLQSYGAPITSQELTYLVVIVFGAGTDFALFWLSRFDEELARLAGPHRSAPPDRAAAATRAYVATVPGIACSAGTTILGLAALMASQFKPNHTLGLSMAFALAVALLAAVTLMPALATAMGARLFWPRRKPMSAGASAGRWAAAARFVTARPGLTVAMVALLLAAPLLESFRVAYRVETDGGLSPATSTFARGRDLAAAHFGRGTLFPWTCIVHFDDPAAVERFLQHREPTTARSFWPLRIGATSEPKLRDLSNDVARALRGAGASDVWSYASPLGQSSSVGSGLAAALAPDSLANYWNPAARCLRFEVMGTDEPFSPATIASYRQAIAAVEQSLTSRGVPARVESAGPTPLVANLFALTRSDEWRIKAAVVLVVSAVVYALVRELLLTVMLVSITLIAYQATIGLSAIVFVRVLGYPALNWEVKMFAFVILTAVGQDYNLFLVSRLVEERRRRTLGPAVRHALSRTGGIISSCGLIAAVSLGSLVASGQFFLAQMGFALAVGTLMDTFVVRPFLLPALLVIMGRPRRESATDSPLARH